MSTTDLPKDGRTTGFGTGDARYFVEAYLSSVLKVSLALAVANTFSRNGAICS